MNSQVNYTSSESYRTGTKAMGRRSKGTSGTSREVTMDYMSLGIDADTDAQKVLKRSFNDNKADPSVNLNIPADKYGPIVINPPTPPVKAPKPKAEKKTITKSRSKRW